MVFVLYKSFSCAISQKSYIEVKPKIFSARCISVHPLCFGSCLAPTCTSQVNKCGSYLHKERIIKPLKWFNYRIVAVLFFTLLFASISSVGAIPLQGNAMQVSCPSEIGDGASSATVKQAMCDAFIRNGGFDGVGAINPDIANGKVHNWGITTVEDPNDYQIQDFEGGGLYHLEWGYPNLQSIFGKSLFCSRPNLVALS